MFKKGFELIGVSLLSLGLCAHAFAQTASAQGIWWNPAESGWGINLNHQGDVIFAAWFTYDTSGNGIWWVAPLFRDGEKIYRGDLIQVTGPPLGTEPYDQTEVVESVVGMAELTFTDTDQALFYYQIGSVVQQKEIEPFIFRAQPNCIMAPEAVSPELAANYSGMWWAANRIESGWGINLAHQSGTIFATWFTYDAHREPRWLIATLWDQGDEVFAGYINETSGPSFDSEPFSPQLVEEHGVGEATIAFIDGDSATLTYTVDEVSRTKNLAQLVFDARISQCSEIEGVYGWKFFHSMPPENVLEHHLNTVTAPEHPVRWGNSTQRFELRPGECYGNDCTRPDGVFERNEMSQTSHMQQNFDGDEYWYGISFYVDGNSADIDEVFHVFQFLQRPDPAGEGGYYPSFMFRKFPGANFLAVAFPTVRQEAEVVGPNLLTHGEFFDTWHDVVIHARWTSEEDGFMRVWVNGVLKMDYAGNTITLVHLPLHTYFKYGIYRPAADRTTIAHIDEVRRGKSRAEVDIRLIETSD